MGIESQTGMRSFTGDAFRIADRRARRQLLQLQNRLAANTRQVDRFGQAYKPIGRGGKPIEVAQFHITDYGGISGPVIRKQWFLCHGIDENGNPITIDDDQNPIDPFPVYAYSKPAINGNYGEQELDECNPHYVIGDLIFAAQRTVFMGPQSGVIADWFALDTFVVFGAPIVV